MMNSETRNRSKSVKSFAVCFYCNETFRSLSILLKHTCSAEQDTLALEPLDDFSDIDSIDLDQENTFAENLLETPKQGNTELESNTNFVNENSFLEPGCEEAIAKETVPENSELATATSEERLSELDSEVVRVVTKLVIDVSHKLLTETKLDVSEVITEVEPNANDDCNVTSPDLVSKVLQYYEKQTSPGILDNFCKSPPVEVEFQSPCSQLPVAESCSPRQNDTQIELNATDNSNTDSTSERKHDEKNITQNINVKTLEPQVLNTDDTFSQIDPVTKMNIQALKTKASNVRRNLSFSVESDSSDMFSRSSSVEMDLDYLGCGDDQASDSDDSDTPITLSSDQESEPSKHKRVPAKLPASDNTVTSFSELDLNITNHNSKIVKSCCVKIQDIFLTLRNAKVSPQKIFSSKKWFVCDVCDKFFRLRSDLSIHYLSHSTAKPYTCNICDKSFLKESNLLKHNLTHTLKKKHKCSVCNMSFTKKSLLTRHKLTHSKEKPKPYACDKCDKSYAIKFALTEHYLTHSDARPYVCEICSKTFALKRHLRKHYYSHNKNEKSSCDICFKTFKRKDHLKNHYNTHTDNKPHKCKICNKAYHLLLNLNNHYIFTHRNERPFNFLESIETPAEENYKCDLCFKIFKRKNNLDDHYNTHTNDRPYKCKICNKAFPMLFNLNSHYGFAHQTEMGSEIPGGETLAEENYKCDLCPKIFKRKHNLTAHYNIHTNDGLNICKICNKAFTSLFDLNFHNSTFHKTEMALKLPERVDTSADCKIEKNPVIHKIAVTAEVHRSENTPLVVTPAIVHVKKDSFFFSARRKSSKPKKYLQPNSDL